MTYAPGREPAPVSKFIRLLRLARVLKQFGYGKK